MSETVKTYRFVNDYAVITFTVPGQDTWSEDEWDSAAQSDLEAYVTTPEQYYLDDTFESDDFLNL